MLEGIARGFHTGCQRGHRLTPARRNTPSTYEQVHVVEEYLSREVTVGGIICPFPLGAVSDLQVSRMGVIPIGHIPGNWRLITDLSFPPWESVNDGIEPAFCSLSYTSVEKAARAAQSLGPGALVAKTDIQAAYRLVPVHPEDRPLLGVRWYDDYYVDRMLPFGLRSAPNQYLHGGSGRPGMVH